MTFIRDIPLAIAATAALMATPALARTNDAFTGARAEVTAGFNDFERKQDATYTGALGFDAPVSDRVTLGAEVTGGNVFDRDERLLSLAGRVGYAFDTDTLGYVKAGYTNLNTASDIDRNLGGAVVGAGVQQVIPGSRVYVTAQYDYSDFARGLDSHAGRVGIGIRF